MKQVDVVLNNGVDWSTVTVGVVTGIVVAVSAVLIAQWFENRRWNAQQVTFANTARADRLREIYGRMAQAAVSLKAVLDQRKWILGTPQPDRDERHIRDIKDALNNVAAVGGQVLIETTAEPVSAAYLKVVSGIDRYMSRERDMEPGAERVQALNQLSQEINAGTDEVIRLAKEHLDQLTTPPVVSLWKFRGQ